MTNGLSRDLVCHAGDWQRVQPWPRPLPAGRGADGANDRTPDEEAGKDLFFSPLMAGVLLLARAWKFNHMASKVPKGLGSVAITTVWHQTWVLLVNCHPIHLQTISAPGAKTRSMPVAADTTTRNSRQKSQKGLPFGTPKVCSCL